MLSSSYGQKCNMPTYSNSWRRKKGINLPNIPTMCNYVESLAGHNKDLIDTDFAECGWSSKSKLQKLTCMVSNGRKIANKPKITRFLRGEKKSNPIRHFQIAFPLPFWHRFLYLPSWLHFISLHQWNHLQGKQFPWLFLAGFTGF